MPIGCVPCSKKNWAFGSGKPNGTRRSTATTSRCKKRKLDEANFQLAQLAQASEGFSGAEIEQVIIAAQYAALSDNAPLSHDHVQQELHQTCQLSVIRAEDFNACAGGLTSVA